MRDRAPAAFENDARCGADEGVAADLVAVFRRLEQERVAAVVDLLKRGDRRLRVGDESV